MKDEIYISVDIETSGPIAPDYSMLSIGACVVGNTSQNYYSELKPLNKNYVPSSLKISGFNLNKLIKYGEDPKIAMINFQNWIHEISTNKNPVMVGFNASFDWGFINYYSQKYLLDNIFGIGPLDIKSYMSGKLNCNWDDTKCSNIEKKLNFKFQNKHNALEDAIEQANFFEFLTKYK